MEYHRDKQNFQGFALEDVGDIKPHAGTAAATIRASLGINGSPDSINTINSGGVGVGELNIHGEETAQIVFTIGGVAVATILVNALGAIAATMPYVLPSYTVSTLPTASSFPGGLIYVSNGASNKRLAISDGTNWRFPDGNVVS